jgi:hypothetical protein
MNGMDMSQNHKLRVCDIRVTVSENDQYSGLVDREKVKSSLNEEWTP